MVNVENLKKRVYKKIDEMGEPFTLNGLQNTSRYKGVFYLLDNSLINLYMDDIEALSLVRPALKLIVKSSLTLNVGDIIVRQSVSYKIKKFFTYYYENMPIHTIAILSEYEE